MGRCLCFFLYGEMDCILIFICLSSALSRGNILFGRKNKFLSVVKTTVQHPQLTASHSVSTGQHHIPLLHSSPLPHQSKDMCSQTPSNTQTVFASLLSYMRICVWYIIIHICNVSVTIPSIHYFLEIIHASFIYTSMGSSLHIIQKSSRSI